MRRRKFITLLGGAAAAWPLPVRAQQQNGMRRVGVLMGWSDDGPFRAQFAAFVERLAQLGWVDGRNVRIDVHWTNADIDRARTLANELTARQPDVILAGSTPVTAALLKETRTIPIVFAVVSDPVGAGFVASLARPGGNVTGFTIEEGEMAGKKLSLLREASPRFTRAAIMFNPDTAPGGGTYFLGSFEAAAQSMMAEAIVARVRSDAEIESVIASLGGEKSALVIESDSFMVGVSAKVISAALRHKVPTIGGGDFARNGGLLAYGPNNTDLFRRSADYVDRILRGAKPSDLPVQVPVQYELAINLKTAMALGLTVPQTLLATADEVIE